MGERTGPDSSAPGDDDTPQSLINKFLSKMPDSVDKSTAEQLSKALHGVVLGASAAAAATGGQSKVPDRGARVQAIGNAAKRLKRETGLKKSLLQRIEKADQELAKMRKEYSEAEEKVNKATEELQSAYRTAMDDTPVEAEQNGPKAEASARMHVDTGDAPCSTAPFPPCTATQPDTSPRTQASADQISELLAAAQKVAESVAVFAKLRQKKMAEAGFEPEKERESSRSPRRDTKHHKLVEAEKLVRQAQDLAKAAAAEMGVEEKNGPGAANASTPLG